MVINYAKDCEKSMLITTIVTFVLGIVLLIEPQGSIKLITSVIGIISMLLGGIQIVDYIRKSKEQKVFSVSLILGIILIVIGLFLFINKAALVKFITVIIGCAISVKALFKIQFALNIKGVSEKWMYNLIAGIALMVLGVIMLVNPFQSAALFLRIVGGILVVGSVMEFIETMAVMKTLDDVKELPFAEKKKKKDKEEKVVE